MSATTWLIIAIIGFSLAGIALIIAIFMFVKMNIPSIIGDLSGKTVAREIKAMREFNNANGDRRFRPSKVNLERGVLTEKVEISQDNRKAMAEAHASKRLDNIKSGELSEKKTYSSGSGTVGLNDFEINPTEALDEGNEPTEMLSDGETEVLNENATEVLNENATEVLSNDTTVLNGTTVLGKTEKLTEESEVIPVPFKITKSEIVIHTDEVIKWDN